MVKIGDYDGRDYYRTELTRQVQQRPDGLYVRVMTRNEVMQPGKDMPFTYDTLKVADLLTKVQQDIRRIEQATADALGTAGAMALKPQLDIQLVSARQFRDRLEDLMRQHGGARTVAPRTGRRR